MGAGDVLLVMWGREARRAATEGFDGFSGLHAECLPWLQEREVAVLGSDGISDPMPFVGTPEWPFPGPSDRDHGHGAAPDRQHDAGSPGRPLCRPTGRWEFLFTMAPLRIVRGTGCPVNPVAVL